MYVPYQKSLGTSFLNTRENSKKSKVLEFVKNASMNITVD